MNTTMESDIVEVANIFVAKGKSKEAIIRAIRKLSAAEGLDPNTIIKQINWNTREGETHNEFK